MAIESIIGKKIGMTQYFRENGRSEAVTIIEAGPCSVIQIRTTEKEGYNSVQLGFGNAKRINSPEKGHLKGFGQYNHLKEIRIDDVGAVGLGDKIDVSVFKAGDLVNITGISKGKGFAGTIKRHGFHGGPKTHGQSDRHRAPGSIGAGSSPGRVLKGTRMAGHMGNSQVTAANLEVIEADQTRNLLLIKGAVPGADNGLLVIKKSNRSK